MRQNRRRFEKDQSTKEVHFVIEGKGMYMKAWGRLSQNMHRCFCTLSSFHWIKAYCFLMSREYINRDVNALNVGINKIANKLVDFIDFSYAHLGCDAIAFRDENKLIGQVKLVAYASNEQHNKLLRKIFLDKYGKKDFCIETGLSAAQADGIF